MGVNISLSLVNDVQLVFSKARYSAFGKYSDPLTLLHYSLILKCIKSFFSLIKLHTIPHNDKLKTENDKLFYISIQTLHSVHSWSTFGSDYSLESSWVWLYKIGTPVFGEFLPFFSADPLKVCQVGCGPSLPGYFQVFPEMLDRVQVWALAGPFKDIQRLWLVTKNTQTFTDAQSRASCRAVSPPGTATALPTTVRLSRG
jgi:hypothetical protein